MTGVWSLWYGTPIQGSSISDLVNDVVRTRRGFSPTGRDDFTRVLAKLNTPEDFIRNEGRRKLMALHKIEDILPPSTPSLPTLQPSPPSRPRKRLISPTLQRRGLKGPPPGKRDASIDDGKWLKAKEDREDGSTLNTPKSLVPDLPKKSWRAFPSQDIPSLFNYGHVYHYALESLPTCSDKYDKEDEDDQGLGHMTDKPFKNGRKKYIATVSQKASLTEVDVDWLTRHLGHDVRLHREFYRLHESTAELAKVSKLLLAVDNGSLETLKGKTPWPN
ncbi:hypothetical protein QZH41_005012 [Actinostola sp. cb2023]|nr:hypothetical protein QZH41_005012 [Actinostola sp. cb2023]